MLSTYSSSPWEQSPGLKRQMGTALAKCEGHTGPQVDTCVQGAGPAVGREKEEGAKQEGGNRVSGRSGQKESGSVHLCP